MKNIFRSLAFIFPTLFSTISCNKKILLTNVQTLTLYKDQYTTGRRSSPVPQLKCVGGTAGCSVVIPSVVQCYNRGTNGVDVQWECKTDMDSAFKFGSIQVTCEGYDYPEDPYITAGSCGLEYTIDHASGSYGTRDSYSMKPPKKSSILADIVFWIIVLLLLVILYRTFIAPASSGIPPRTPGAGGGGGWWPGGGGGGGPPPPGFRPDYYPADDTCSGNTFGRNSGGSYGAPGTGGAGFWTGLGAGGLLGYLMGNRGTGNDYYARRRPFWDSSGPSPSSHGAWSSGSGLGTSGTTRSSSGFGGTRRR